MSSRLGPAVRGGAVWPSLPLLLLAVLAWGPGSQYVLHMAFNERNGVLPADAHLGLGHWAALSAAALAALFAFRHGATGIGFWCYNQGGDPWGRMDMEYALVYPGRTKPVTSRRWEAAREC